MNSIWPLSFRSGLLATALLTCGLIAWHFGDLFGNLNHVYLGMTEDGIKNYYTVLYHIQHDSTYSRFEGMNYPHGEQVLFTDNQPWLANSIKFISQNIINISGYTVGIMNFLMLVSILVAALLIYVLLHRLKLPPWYACLVATGVALFSPQLTRMGGHYALAYCWVVPLILLLAHWFHTKPTWRKSTIIGLVVFLIAGLHFYFFALGAFFLALFVFFRWAFQPSVKGFWQSGVHFGLQVVLPFVLFSLWLNLTDDVTDRPTDPFGFLVYKSTLKSAFLPIDFPHGKFLPDLLGFRMEEIVWESVAYIGLAADIGLLLLLGLGFMQLVKRNYWSWLRPLQHGFLDPMFSAGVFLFAFSLGVPFIFGLESLVEYLGPLKQFRGIGRFSWIFFYVMQVMAFYVFYTRFFKDKTGGLRWLAIGLPLLVLMTEAWMFDTKPKYGLNTIPELEKLQGEEHWLRNVNVDDYQALIPLPYNHTGSENFWISDKESDVVKKSMIMSLQSGLPMTSVQMSRTSFSQTWQNLRLKWEPLEAAFALLDHLTLEKPFLIWVPKELRDDPRILKSLAKYCAVVFEDEEQVFYHLPVQVLREQYQRQRKQHEAFFDESTWTQRGAFLVSDSIRSFLFDEMEDKESTQTFRGKGAYEGLMHDFNPIHRGTLEAQDSTDYILSCWVYMGQDGQPNQRFEFHEDYPEGTNVTYATYRLDDVLVGTRGEWGLIEYKFRPRHPESKLNFYLQKSVLNDRKTWFDDVLIRPADVDVRRNYGDTLWLNNRWYDVVPAGNF